MSYKPHPSFAGWTQNELKDYLQPQGWKVKEHNTVDGFVLYKKEGQTENNCPYYKIQGELVGVKPEVVLQVIHHKCLEYARSLDPHFQQGSVLERLPASAVTGIADEAIVYYRQAHLPIVDDRDFVTICFIRTFKNPTTGNKCTAFFSRSIDDHPKAPAAQRGCTRAHVLSCCAFVEETPKGCLYTYTNMTDVHMKFSIAAEHGSKNFMCDYFRNLKALCGGGRHTA